MVRLTKVDGIGQNEIIKCFGCDLEKAGTELEHCGYCEHWQAVVDRLAAYEGTGLEPEEIKDILERYRGFRAAISDETGQPMVSWTRASELVLADKGGAGGGVTRRLHRGRRRKSASDGYVPLRRDKQSGYTVYSGCHCREAHQR